MIFVRLLLFLVGVCTDNISAKFVFSSKSIRQLTASIVTVIPLSVLAIDPSPPSPESINSLRNVVRVQNSMKYIEDDIEKIARMPNIVTSIKALQSNYRLQENLQKSLQLIPEGTLRNEAKVHGKFAIEDLTLIYEYFSDQVDDITGLPKTTLETLKFAFEATKAAESELKLFVSAVPSSIREDIVQEIQKEFSTTTGNGN